MTSGNNNSISLFNAKLTDKICTSDIFAGIHIPTDTAALCRKGVPGLPQLQVDTDGVINLPAFEMDEKISTSRNKNNRHLSIRKYTGMPSGWHSCDFVLLPVTTDSRAKIFIIEKTNILESAKGIKESSGKYRKLKGAVMQELRQDIKCPADTPDAVVSAMLRRIKEIVLGEELAGENIYKIYSSVLMLCRLINDKYFNDLSLPELDYYFIILSAASADEEGNIAKTNVAALSREIKKQTDESMKAEEILEEITDIINKKLTGKTNSKSSLRVKFPGIQTPKEFIAFLQKELS